MSMSQIDVIIDMRRAMAPILQHNIIDWYDSPVCTFFETLYSPHELVDGKHGPIAGWLVLFEATAPPGRRPVRLRATVTFLSGSRRIEIRAKRQ
jgi:hypothetical protein